MLSKPQPTMLLPLLLGLVSLASQLALADNQTRSHQEIMGYCVGRTGLKEADIKEYHVKNEK